MEIQDGKDWFLQHLHKLLNALYNPRVLRDSPLGDLLEVSTGRPGSELRRILSEAIETLRPAGNTPQGARTWRVYQVLRRRYIEQLTQHEVANHLGLSVRQLQREEKLAREILADYLWTTYHLEEKIAAHHQATQEEEGETGAPTRAQELAQLHDALPASDVQISNVLEEVLKILSPLIKAHETTVTTQIPADLPHLHLRTPLLRQALLNILSALLHCAAGTDIHIAADDGERELRLDIRTLQSCAGGEGELRSHRENFTMAEQLLALCQGTLEWSDVAIDAPFRATLQLPLAKRFVVLAVDDNADVLQLYKRYTSGSPYQLVGTQEATTGLALAEELTPQVIVLDVMMPGRDGWTLLGQLREHPKMRDIPVIVCSILSQKQLALSLGAADFVRKPVNRSQFLAALERQRQPR